MGIMKILLLGGTGAMGVPLVNILLKFGHDVVVTSRIERKSRDLRVRYIKGDAKNVIFLREVLKERYDVIVDFMHYHADELNTRIEILLSSTDHYFFLSSSRVYAASDIELVEESPRLLEVVQDSNYLSTDEYALSKARCENIILKSAYNNWTIIRPYITYNNDRLQLGMFEKEGWLYRALKGHAIVFSEDLVSVKISLTFGDDVAGVIAMLIEKKSGFGEIIHIVGDDSMTWGEVLNLYCDTIDECVHFRPKVVMIENGTELSRIIGNYYKFKYDRLVTKIFNNHKVNRLCQEEIKYTPMNKGLKNCLKNFLNEGGEFKYVNIMVEAYLDKHSGELASMSEFNSLRRYAKYLICRDTPYIHWKIKKTKNSWW